MEHTINDSEFFAYPCHGISSVYFHLCGQAHFNCVLHIDVE